MGFDWADENEKDGCVAVLPLLPYYLVKAVILKLLSSIRR